LELIPGEEGTYMSDYKTIIDSNNFIVLDKYTKDWAVAEGYQTEGDLERELIDDLINQGYEYLSELKNSDAMLSNIRVQIQTLKAVVFSDGDGSGL
jgi:type I restriction enzyme R subunit